MQVVVHEGFVLNPLLFIIALEAFSQRLRTGCLWEILHTNDLALPAGTMEPWKNISRPKV